MSDTLRDQLLALGLGKKPQHSTAQTKNKKHQPQKSTPKPAPPNAEIDLAKAYALRNHAEQAEKQQQAAEAAERARLKKERKEKLNQLLHNQALNDANADIARNFQHHGKIRRVYVNAQQLQQLNAGELGIVHWNGRYLLVTQQIALAAQEINPHSLALMPDPNLETDTDIPDDLIW